MVVLTSFSSRRFLCFLFIGLLLCVRTKSGRQSAEVKSDYICRNIGKNTCQKVLLLDTVVEGFLPSSSDNRTTKALINNMRFVKYPDPRWKTE